MFLNVTVGPKAEESGPVAEELQKALQQLTIVPPRDTKGGGVVLNISRTLSEAQVSLIGKLVEQFEAVLCSEMVKKGIFYVTPKRAYATDVLLTSADKVLDDGELKYLTDDAKEDIRKAGACLLFDQFTASGFHAARAVEGTARRYYELVTGESATETEKMTGDR